MQPILILAIVGVAAIALGTGFLNNDIKLWIQDFGVGAGNIELELDHAVIDFNIVQLPDDSTGFYKNRINECIVTPEDTIGTLTPMQGQDFNNLKVSEVTCKITGKDPVTWNPNGKVITEGKVCALQFLAGQKIHVPLGVTSPSCPSYVNPVTGPTLIDPKQAGDVILVVHANTYSMGT